MVSTGGGYWKPDINTFFSIVYCPYQRAQTNCVPKPSLREKTRWLKRYQKNFYMFPWTVTFRDYHLINDSKNNKCSLCYPFGSLPCCSVVCWLPIHMRNISFIWETFLNSKISFVKLYLVREKEQEFSHVNHSEGTLYMKNYIIKWWLHTSYLTYKFLESEDLNCS